MKGDIDALINSVPPPLPFFSPFLVQIRHRPGHRIFRDTSKKSIVICRSARLVPATMTMNINVSCAASLRHASTGNARGMVANSGLGIGMWDGLGLELGLLFVEDATRSGVEESSGNGFFAAPEAM